jgi:hypothetical protein
MKQHTYPYLLQQFLKDTGWPSPRDPQVAVRMQVALEFFHRQLAAWINLPLDATDKGYARFGSNPFAFKINGRVTKLMGGMQGINFNFPVESIGLAEGHEVRRYGKRGELRGKPATGLWYTEKDVPADRLALPPEQATPYSYKVIAAVSVLASTAGDMLVDWNMNPALQRQPTVGIDYHYRHGGGLQYVIPSAALVLRPV